MSRSNYKIKHRFNRALPSWICLKCLKTSVKVLWRPSQVLFCSWAFFFPTQLRCEINCSSPGFCSCKDSSQIWRTEMENSVPSDIFMLEQKKKTKSKYLRATHQTQHYYKMTASSFHLQSCDCSGHVTICHWLCSKKGPRVCVSM